MNDFYDILNGLARIGACVFAYFVGMRVLRIADRQEAHHNAQMAMLDMLLARKSCGCHETRDQA